MILRRKTCLPSAPVSGPDSSFRRLPAVLLLSVALAAGAAGCAADPGESGSSAQSGTPEEEAAARDAGDSPEALAVKARLEELAGTDPSPDRNGITQAFVAAGFAEAGVEVSADRTPTGLDVDAIQGAAVQGNECIFGEVRDGAVTVSILPVLDGGRCFVGN